MQNGKKKRGESKIEAHFFEEELPEYDYEEYEDPNFVYGGEDDLGHYYDDDEEEEDDYYDDEDVDEDYDEDYGDESYDEDDDY